MVQLPHVSIHFEIAEAVTAAILTDTVAAHDQINLPAWAGHRAAIHVDIAVEQVSSRTECHGSTAYVQAAIQ